MALSDEHYMQLALKEARKAFDEEEVPIGAVIVLQEQIIARAHNQVEKLNDSTAHAEILALTSAYSFLGSKYLPGATLYVTIQPCLMCAGAIYWSKINKIVYGASDEKHGGLTPDTYRGKGVTVVGEVCKDECAALIKHFFRARRQ
jgi:tRNA(adenine34) deaminase